MKALLYWMVALMVTMGACTSDVDKDKDDDEEIAEWDELAVTLKVSRPTTVKFGFTSEANDDYALNDTYPTSKVDFPTELEINWGDGQSSNSDSHEYQSAGTYLVKIKGKGIGTLNNYYLTSNARIEQFTVKSWPSLVYLETLPVKMDFTKHPKLENVSCYFDDNSSLDFSKCPRLKYLFLGGNVTGLNLTGCTELKIMECEDCKLSKLDVSSCTKLEILDCSDNQITQLTLNSALTNLICDVNQLKSLDLSKNTELFELYAPGNQLANLDVSKNTKLASLKVEGNQLTNLDLSKNTKLRVLNVGSNQLTSLDVSKNAELYQLTCSYNQLKNLDVSGHIKLEWIFCENNQLTAMDVRECSRLSLIYCAENQLDKLAFNKIYNDLPYNNEGIILVYDNPSTGNTYIATQKGWEVKTVK